MLSLALMLTIMPTKGLTAYAGSEDLAANQAAVEYVDANGGKGTCDSYTVVDENTKNWAAGWYVVKDEVTINDKVVAEGNVNLILCDGAKLVVSTESGAAIGNDGGLGHFNLTIYGQKNGTGELTATGENGIRDNGTSENCGTLTINGARVSATGNYCGFNFSKAILINGGNVTAIGRTSNGIQAPDITIKDGDVTVTTNNTYQNTISATGTITINGGSIQATGGAIGLFSSGGMNISGGSVTASGSEYGVKANGVMTISNSNVEAEGGTWHGISSKKITINNSQVTATGLTVNQSAGLAAFGNNDGEGLVIINSGNVTANGNHVGIDAKKEVMIKGGTVNANGTDTASGHYSYGIYANNDITIEGGTVNAKGNTDSGIYSNLDNVIIKGGKVTAIGKERGLHGTVKNSMAGTGWTDTEGKTGRTKININTDPGQTLTFKRVEFPENVVPPAPNPPAPSVVPAAPVEIQDLPAVKISKPAKGKKAITVKWKKISKKKLKKSKKRIDGIEIQVSGPGVNQVVTAGKKKTSKKIKGLLPKQKYICRVRAYNYTDGVKHVSAWSKWKTAKTK